MMTQQLAWRSASLRPDRRQWPEFSQQYRQRLGGALDELRRVVAAFEAEAASHALTPAEAVGRLKTNPDPLAREPAPTSKAISPARRGWSRSWPSCRAPARWST